MVVEIITSRTIADHNFIDGQEYTSLGIVYSHPEPPCDNPNRLSKHYSLVVEGHIAPILFPADSAALTTKLEPKTPNTGRWQDLHKEMTEDAVVKNGDYATAILDRLGVDITEVGPDYDMTKLMKLLRAYEKHNMKADEKKDNTEQWPDGSR